MTILEPGSDELRRRAEESCSEFEPALKAELPVEEDTRRLVHELRVHQIEIELQNEELRESRALAETGFAQYLDLYEFAPVPYLTVDGECVILKANLAAASLFSMDRSILLGHSLRSHLTPEARSSMDAFLRKTLASGRSECLETRIVLAGGEKLFVLIEGLGRDQRPGECRLALIDITEREAARAALAQADREKAILMRELQHRVKNTLNIVNSLLGLGSEELVDTDALEVVEKARARIMALAQVYEQLYLDGDALSVDLQAYLGRFIVPLIETYAVDRSRYRLVTRFETARLDAQRAALVGLILSELISNATKYAYGEGESGELRVTLLESGGLIELCVSDDGAGLPPGVDPAATSSMGFFLLRSLASQLGADLEYTSPKGKGLTVRLRIGL